MSSLRHTVRLLLKDRSFTITALLTLALCIGANTAIFSVVRSVVLRPSTTTPSTGHASCVKTTTVSPGSMASSGPSAIVSPVFLCATVGIRRASAERAEDARPTAYASMAWPPDRISTMRVPARYSPSSTAVTIEMPASRSELKSPAISLRASPYTSGTPPMASAANKGHC